MVVVAVREVPSRRRSNRRVLLDSAAAAVAVDTAVAVGVGLPPSAATSAAAAAAAALTDESLLTASLARNGLPGVVGPVLVNGGNFVAAPTAVPAPAEDTSTSRQPSAAAAGGGGDIPIAAAVAGGLGGTAALVVGVFLAFRAHRRGKAAAELAGATSEAHRHADPDAQIIFGDRLVHRVSRLPLRLGTDVLQAKSHQHQMPSTHSNPP